MVKDEIDWQIFLSGRPHLNDAMGETFGGGGVPARDVL